VIEDEPKMAQLLRRGLTEDGYAVDVAADGTDGFGAAVSRGYERDRAGRNVARHLRIRGVPPAAAATRYGCRS